MSSLSYSWWISMTIIWRCRGFISYYRYSFLISFKLNNFVYIRNNYVNISNDSMMTRYQSRGGYSRSSHFYRRIRITMRNSFIYCIRNFFFVRFFWAFFHRRLSPNIDVGSVWPPFGIKVFNPFQVPLLNTIVLISSGISVTWAHHALIIGNFTQTKLGLLITVILGIYFTILQGLEYFEASFTFADRIYGSTFFIATGFHGLHVLVGTLFLVVILYRHINYEFRIRHHFGFEAAAWYWHFVDVVWLFLYIIIYWWGRI